MKFKLLSLSLILSGCTSQLQVNTIHNSDLDVAYINDDKSTGTFRNFDPGEKAYPVTCQENCYPEHADLVCDSINQQCHYQGVQPKPKLNTKFKVKWLGHASFELTTPDKQIWLIDPVFGQFDWPVDWAFNLTGGFFRHTVSVNDQNLIRAKSVDAVFYSHIHYDHFNKADIKKLGTSPQYFTPLKFSEHFPNGSYTVSEMTWFSKTKLGETTIHFVPANHFSSRIWVPFIYSDWGKTLWGGWLFEHQGKKVFFAGDTGYSAHFKEIFKRYGEIDVCLMPIASYYHPENGQWYRYVHTTPEDALVASQELGCKVMVPWGYGNKSWQMGDISSHSALKRLLHMHKELNTDVSLYILNEGESVRF
ncbi:putative hydrolase [Pseudoalteromonas luteoviolacea B = ATCC 29581]|nr:putative hydrolase [Pseudoalteromonas luteoviolacea B = ATCC 29581]